MARGVTEQDVFTAADRLLVRGERPTIERVRLEIGRGSPNTINPLLDSWWLCLSKRHAGAAPDALPVPIRLATEALYQEILRQAEQMARQSVTTLRDEVEKDRASVFREAEQLQAERLGAQSLGDALKSELVELRAINERLTRQISDLTAQLEIERGEAAQARLTAQLAVEERDRMSAATQSELTRVREQWQGNERHWLKEIEALRDEIKRSRKDSEGSQLAHRRQVTALEREANGRTAEMQSVRAQLLAATNRLTEESHRRVMAEAEVEAHRKAVNVPASRRRRPLQRVR